MAKRSDPVTAEGLLLIAVLLILVLVVTGRR